MDKDRELEQLAEFMRWAIGAGMIVAGADKFTHLLCDWDKYLSPRAEKLIPMEGSKFMKLTGLIEIAAGAGVLFRPTTQWASFIGSAWLLGIAGNLLTHPVN